MRVVNANHATNSSWIATFALADLLFFPRLPFVSIPISLIFIIIDISKLKVTKQNVGIYFLLNIICIGSVGAGLVVGDGSNAISNIKRAFQLVSIILYLFYFLSVEMDNQSIRRVLRSFFLVNFLLLLVFYGNESVYSNFVLRLYPETDALLDINMMFGRYSYIFSDPNSAGYLTAIALAGYVAIETNIKWIILCITLASATIFATQSRGAYGALLLIYLQYTIFAKTSNRNRVIILLATAIALFALMNYFEEKTNELLQLFDNRFEDESDLGGGRISKYKYFLDAFNVMPLGYGYTILVDGMEFRPHSDIIRLNISYGLLAIPLLLYFMVPRYKNQIGLFVVAFIPFAINSLIDDYRLLGVYLALLAILQKCQKQVGNNTRNKNYHQHSGMVS